MRCFHYFNEIFYIIKIHLKFGWIYYTIYLSGFTQGIEILILVVTQKVAAAVGIF